jgi:hypothetical protein
MTSRRPTGEFGTWRFGARLLPACLALAMSTEAAALSARVRWLPSTDPRVVGYEVHVRPAGAPYATAIDVGVPVADGDGALSHVVDGLVEGGAYRVTVTGYDGDGGRSGCPGELALGTADPCAVDQCCPGAACYFGNELDGLPCGDACAVCAGGACSAAAVETALTTTTTLGLAQRATGSRLRAKGWFIPPAPVDPRATGLTLGVAGDGVLGIVVPGGALGANAAATTFRLRRDAAVLSLRSLRLATTAQGAMRVTALANDSNLGLSTSGWALRVGNLCARATDLGCTIGAHDVTCR